MTSEQTIHSDPTTEPIIARPFQREEDFWKVRNLLIETYPITPTDWNWEIRRWDGQRFHDADPSVANMTRKGPIHLWETREGRLVGAAHHEGGLGYAFLELHPDYRHLEAEMIAWAEDHLAKTSDSGQRELAFFVYDYDSPRRSLLLDRGYEQRWSGVARRMRLNTRRPIPTPEIADGYTMRTTEPTPGDAQCIADLLNAAFNRTFHHAGELTNFYAQSPSFRHDLDFVAVAPDGSFAAYAGLTLEDVNNYAVFEPVCTHPDHRRKGLARALMLAGLHRLRALGVADVYVGTGDQVAANKLYDGIGFTEAYKGYGWKKVW
jgi:mycothiol synthase